MNWRTRITGPWGFMRIVRLILGIIVLIEAWRSKELIFGALGIVLLWQSLMNVACCGSAGCDIDHTQNKPSSLKNNDNEVIFTEITKE